MAIFPKSAWILIANASLAYIYQTNLSKFYHINGKSEKNLKLLKTLTHEQSRKKTSDLVTDKPGKYHTGNAAHGAFVEHSNPKVVEADRFARELIQILDHARNEGQYEDLIIVAEPHFRGLLNKHLNHQLAKHVHQVIEKDYTSVKGRELANHLLQHL